MANACPSISEKEARAIRKKLYQGLRRLHISNGEISSVELEAALSKLMTEKHYTIETLFEPEHKQEILNAIAQARVKKVKEQEALDNNTIGKAVVRVGKAFDKTSPAKNPTTLYVYTENLQAHNYFATEKVAVPGLIAPDTGIKTSVTSTSAMLRTNTNGDRNPNTLGLVVKKNAQGKDGKFLNDGQGVFEDTDEDYKAFVDTNMQIIKEIKARLEAEDSPYTEMSIVGKIAMEKSGLPKRFAEALQTMLYNQLGISTQVLPSKFGKDLWGLEVQEFGKQEEGKRQKSERQKRKEKDEADAAESLKAERPKLLSDTLSISREHVNLLARVFPNIEERVARVDFITTVFSQTITKLLEDAVKMYEEIMAGDHTEEDARIFASITSGTDAERRKALLENVPFYLEGSDTPISAAEYIIRSTRGLMYIVLDSVAQLDAGAITEAEATSIFMYDNYIAQEFAAEARDKGWEGEILRRMKLRRLRTLAEAFKVMVTPEVFGALLKEAAANIEFLENIRIIFEDENRLVAETEQDMQNAENDEEGSVDNRSGLNLIKYKLINPATTLSTRMKVLLGQLYKRKEGKYEYNSLGQRVRMNASLAYYILLHHFSTMNRSQDFEGALDEAVKKYPWVAALVDKLDEDEDLKREFYTTFRKVFVPYVLIGNNGKLLNLNYTASRESFRQEVSRLYESHSPLSEYSIYDVEGLCDVRNVSRVHNWVVYEGREKGISAEERIARHPFAWVKRIFDNPKKNDFNTANILKAISILKGEVKGVPGIVDLLHALGVPTDTLDLDSLVPNVDEETMQKLESDDLEEKAEGFSKLTELYSDKVRGNISRIIQSAITITRKNSGFAPGMHLLEEFKGAYTNIADSLSIASEAFSQASFLGMENSPMFSYTMPDRLSIMIGIISQAETEEEARQYLDEEFGHYDFYRDQATQEWLNTWLDMLYSNPAVRRSIAYANVLGFSSRAKGNSIQDVNDNIMTDGIITAMFAAGDAADGTKMGWYQNPLFSDTAALVMVRMPRFSGEGYKERILDGFVKIMRQEIERIVFLLNADEDNIEIDFFNDKKSNGTKFNYFPELNSRRAEILETLARISSDDRYSATEIKEMQDNYLKGIIRGLIEGEELADGTRTEGLLDKFLSTISDERGLKILMSIAALESSENKEEDANEVEEDQANQDNPEDIFAENPEERKVILSEKQKQEVKEKLTEYFYNSLFGQMQFDQFLKGDLAYFKSYDDSVKRAKESYAAGERMYALDANGNPITEKAIYMEDLESVSTTWTGIRDILDADNPNLSEWERSIYRGAVNTFLKITDTDGQSFRTLDSFRKIFKAYGGRWTDGMETAFQHIKSGQFTAADFVALWNPIKQFIITHEDITLADSDGNTRTEKVLVQHKNSEYLINALFTVLNTALNPSPKIRGIQRFMEEHGIDVLHFHSVVKHGGHDFFDINYDYNRFYKDLITVGPDGKVPETIEYKVGDKVFEFKTKGFKFSTFEKALTDALKAGEISQEEYNATLEKYDFHSEEAVVKVLESQLIDSSTKEERQGMIKEFPLEDYMIVQPTTDHLVDHDALFGSQLRNIVPADLSEGFTVTVKVNGKEVTLTKDQVIQHYNTLLVDQLIDSFSSIDRRFMSDQDLSDFLQNIMRGNPKYGDDIKDALSIDPKTGRFKMPLNSPNLRNKVEELLLSVFKNNIQRQKIKGGNVVLVSNFGYSDKLKVKYVDDDATKGVEYIPAYMPAYMSDMYRDYLVSHTDPADGSEYWTIDFEALKANHPDEDILKIIGYRIPTEDKYSIMPIKIVGFMPIVAGATIMLPADIIAMSGTDFDIDKLFLMIKATVRETFSPQLSTAFKDWLAPDLRESLRTTDPEQSKVIERIIRRRQGFTDDELDKFAEGSELFARFMEVEGYEYEYDRAHYRVKTARNVYGEDGELDLDATSRLDGYNKGDRHDIRNNMLIDTIWAILSSPEGTKLSRLPGAYPGVKRGSRQQWILHNESALKKFVEFAGGADKVYERLMGMSTEELEKFFEMYADPENPFTIMAYMKKHRNLMDGNALIGVLAVNSSNHYKLQFLSPGTTDEDGNYIPGENILLNKENKFLFTLPGKGPIVVELVSPQKSPITGVSIGRTAAEFQAASPDNGKDPCLGDLGVSLQTAYRVNFLIHMGFPPEIIGMLNTIDDFTEYGSTLPKMDDLPFEGGIDRIVELVVKFRLSEDGTLEDPIDRSDAAKIASWLDNIARCARTLEKVSTISRVDSPNGALPVKVVEVVQQMFKMEDFFRTVRSPECEILGLDRLIDDTIDPDNFDDYEGLRDAINGTPIPRLQAAYTLGIKGARSLASSQIMELRRPILDAVRRLRIITKRSLLPSETNGTKILQKFFSELPMFLLSTYGSLFSGDTEGKSIVELRNYYIHDFPAKLHAFLEEKKDGKYVHADIRNLTLIRRITNSNRTGIKFNNIGKVSPLSRKHYVEAMDSLLYSEDPEIQKLAIDLLMYAYFDNGLNFGPSNYGIFFTTFFLSSVPGVVDVLQRMNGQAESDPLLLQRYLEQFLFNHPEFIPTTAKKYKAVKKEGDIITIPLKDADFLMGGKDSTRDYVPLVRHDGKVYRRITSGTTISAIQYQEVKVNRTDRVNGKKNAKNYTPFYDATKDAADIEWDKLEVRGAVSSSAKEKKGENNEEEKKEGLDSKSQNAPSEKEPSPEGHYTPEDVEEKTMDDDHGISESLERFEGEDITIPEGPIAAAEHLEETVERPLNAPKDNTPDLTSFKETTEPKDKLCPPTTGK